MNTDNSSELLCPSGFLSLNREHGGGRAAVAIGLHHSLTTVFIRCESCEETHGVIGRLGAFGRGINTCDEQAVVPSYLSCLCMNSLEKEHGKANLVITDILLA